jgi:hypothetical protein
MKVTVGFSPRIRWGVEGVAERRLNGAEACALALRLDSAGVTG